LFYLLIGDRINDKLQSDVRMLSSNCCIIIVDQSEPVTRTLCTSWFYSC